MQTKVLPYDYLAATGGLPPDRSLVGLLLVQGCALLKLASGPDARMRDVCVRENWDEL